MPDFIMLEQPRRNANCAHLATATSGLPRFCRWGYRRANAYAKFKGRVQDSWTGERDKRLHMLFHE